MITCHVGVLFIYHGVVVFSNFSSLLPHSDMMQYAHSLDLLNELSPERYWQGTEIWGGCVCGGGGELYLILQSRSEWQGGGGGGWGVTIKLRYSIPCN